MENVTIKDIVKVTGGILLCGDENKIIREFSIDSREGSEESIFVPIIGERVDAHRFIAGALALNGATFTSEHRPSDPEKPWEQIAKEIGVEKPWIFVEDTVKAMQQVGTYYRNRLSLPVVAVTGSVGKTTTREMIATALSAGKKVFQTLGNQNSQIGVPLTLSRMSKEDEAAVLEIGMSERGQIETLTKMIRPDIAVVTVIGVSHIAQLKSQENICLEKMDIVKGLPEDGIVFLNGDDPFLVPYRGKLPQKTFFYGMSPDCDYRAENIQSGDGKSSFLFCMENRCIPVVLGTMGEHNVRNALVALGVAHQMGVDVAQAAEALRKFQGQRLQIVRCSRCTVIDDTYNASPDSMRASLQVLDAMENVKGRKIAALSDMLELGDEEKKYHYEIGKYFASRQVDELVVFGDLSGEMIRGARDAMNEKQQAADGGAVEGQEGPVLTRVENREEMIEYLLTILRPEDVLLLKASNGMWLSEVAKAIIQS